jgi:hypothetical protein
MWAYPDGYLDMSNTQFALLGLRSAKHLGMLIPDEVVERCAARITDWQEKSGGFVYWLGRNETGGMTAASLAGFAVLAELGKGNIQVETTLRKRKDDIHRAEIFLEQRFDGGKNACAPNGSWPHHVHSYLWAIERWCGLTNRAKIGDHDWYREGAEALLAMQGTDGSFGPDVDDTCFALLFLRKATVTSYQDLSAVWKQLDQEKAVEAKTQKVAPDGAVKRVTECLVAGPIPDKKSLDLVVDPSTLKLERVRPREREKVLDKSFAKVALKSDTWTDLEEASGKRGDSCVWVLAQSLGTDSRATKGETSIPATLWLDVDGPWKLYLDGKLASGEMEFERDVGQPVQVDVDLSAGHHEVVILLGTVDWQAPLYGLRVTDRAGKPLPEVQCSAEPPVRKSAARDASPR